MPAVAINDAAQVPSATGPFSQLIIRPLHLALLALGLRIGFEHGRVVGLIERNKPAQVIVELALQFRPLRELAVQFTQARTLGEKSAPRFLQRLLQWRHARRLVDQRQQCLPTTAGHRGDLALREQAQRETCAKIVLAGRRPPGALAIRLLRLDTAALPPHQSAVAPVVSPLDPNHGVVAQRALAVASLANLPEVGEAPTGLGIVG